MKADVVIVGNGVLGCTTALELVRRDPSLRIVLIGPASRRAAASLAAGAMLNLFAELDPGALSHPVSRFKFRLGRDAQRAWPRHVEWLNELGGFDRRSSVTSSEALSILPGTTIINNTRADALDDASFTALLGYLREYNEPHEIVDPKSLVGYEPSPTARALRAVHLPNEGYVPSRRLFRALDAALHRSPGIQRVDGDATAISVSADTRTVHLSTGETVEGAQIVIANAAAAQALVDTISDLRGRMPAMFYGVGVGVIMRPSQLLPHVVRTNNRGLTCGVHTVPDAISGTVYIGATNFISPTPEYHPRVASVQGLLRAAMEEINVGFYKAQIEEVTLGHRPTSADLFPLIGPTSIPGIWMMTGTKRDGLFMSPVYAAALVDSMLSGAECLSSIFMPERRLIATMSREEGIEKAVAHLWSAGYQHELKLPHSGWEPQVHEMLRRKVVDAYDRAGEHICDLAFGIPAELLDMYRYGHINPPPHRMMWVHRTFLKKCDDRDTRIIGRSLNRVAV